MYVEYLLVLLTGAGVLIAWACMRDSFIGVSLGWRRTASPPPQPATLDDLAGMVQRATALARAAQLPASQLVGLPQPPAVFTISTNAELARQMALPHNIVVGLQRVQQQHALGGAEWLGLRRVQGLD